MKFRNDYVSGLMVRYSEKINAVLYTSKSLPVKTTTISKSLARVNLELEWGWYFSPRVQRLIKFELPPARMSSAAMSTSINGGIDLNNSNAITTVKKDGSGVRMSIDAAIIERVRRDGIKSLTPIIFKITPATNIWNLLGLTPPKFQDQLAST